MSLRWRIFLLVPVFFHRRGVVASIDCADTVLCVNITFLGSAKSLYARLGPAQATGGAAGFDLCAALSENDPELTVAGGERIIVPTGIAIEPLRSGVAGFVYSRSGLGAVKGLTVAQGVGLIDPDYRGEIIVYLLNTSRLPQTVRRGDRIAQLVFQPFLRPDWRVADALGKTERGAGGFGHTGR